ncbi:unnamed protein product [Rotaria sp. Silwood2]|nr:unnamed protein product [Rotaria sp. Silwood2]
MKDELTKWICRSVRPFTIVADVGLTDVLQTVLDLGKKYQDLNITDLLVTPTTISKNVHQLAERYRSLLQPILIEQAESNCLCLCPDLWTDKFRKVNYLGLTAVFIDKNYELISIDLCCCEYQEVDKSGDSVLQAIRRQLDLYGLTSFMDNKKIVFTCDRGPNILKALRGQPIILCFAHRINNILKRCFYETAKKKRIILASTTPIRQQKKSKLIIESSSDESLSEDEVKTPSPLKYIESNTSFSELPSKACELVDIITTSKQLVKYCGLNKSIQDAGGVVLKQSTVVRWLSLSNLLESIDSSYEHLRSILSRSSNTKQSFKLNKINIDGLKDLIRLLSVFKDVSVLVQTGTRPSLHMAYIAMNKLEHHLNGNDVDENGDFIHIDDRHEDIAHSYIRQQIDEILGLKTEQHELLTEPTKKKHKSMEDQFADPDDNSNIHDIHTLPTASFRNDELDRYLRMNIEDIHKIPNPLPFWKHYQQKFPCLSLLARRLFSIPVTSAAVERSFSAAGLVVTERRSSLDPQTLHDILFVRSIQNILEQNQNFFS